MCLHPTGSTETGSEPPQRILHSQNSGPSLIPVSQLVAILAQETSPRLATSRAKASLQLCPSHIFLAVLTLPGASQGTGIAWTWILRCTGCSRNLLNPQQRSPNSQAPSVTCRACWRPERGVRRVSTGPPQPPSLPWPCSATHQPPLASNL